MEMQAIRLEIQETTRIAESWSLQFMGVDVVKEYNNIAV